MGDKGEGSARKNESERKKHGGGGLCYNYRQLQTTLRALTIVLEMPDIFQSAMNF